MPSQLASVLRRATYTPPNEQFVDTSTSRMGNMFYGTGAGYDFNALQDFMKSQTLSPPGAMEAQSQGLMRRRRLGRLADRGIGPMANEAGAEMPDKSLGGVMGASMKRRLPGSGPRY